MASGQCIGSSLAESILFIFLVGLRCRSVEELCIRGRSRCNISCYLHGVFFPVGVICSVLRTAYTVSALPYINIPIQPSSISLCFFSFFLGLFLINSHIFLGGLGVSMGSFRRRVLGSTSQIRLHLPINPRQFIQPPQSNHIREKYITNGTIRVTISLQSSYLYLDNH